jgi:hypothetical protein
LEAVGSELMGKESIRYNTKNTIDRKFNSFDDDGRRLTFRDVVT